MTAGLAKEGARVVDAGLMPTPAAAWAGERREAALTVMISASHNPPEDNGIKVFEPGPRKLDDAGERFVEERYASLADEDLPAAQAMPDPDALGKWLDALAASDQGRLDGLHVVTDAGFGAAASVGSKLLERLGAKVTPLNDTQDGTRLGVKVGAVHPEVVAAAVKREGADVGVAWDGDADRALFADKEGVVRDGDDVLYVLAKAFAPRNELSAKAVVGTSMTNGGLRAALAKHSLRLECVDAVGDRFIAERLRARGYVLGGEPSGHVIAMRWLGTGDGIYTALAVLREMRRTGSPLSALCKGFERFPQLLEAEPAKPGKPALDSLRAASDAIRARSAELERLGGRLVVRYSGTEPLLRIMAEGPASADLAGVVRAVREAYRRS
jgi:phosphoglucosamine mutase